MLIKVKVIPKSSQNIVVQEGNIFKVKITDAPEKGKANKKVIKLLANEFGVAKSQVEIVRGLTKREKVVKISFEGSMVK